MTKEIHKSEQKIPIFKILKVSYYFECYIFIIDFQIMDYKKKSLSKSNLNESYEEIDTRLASGWYVNSLGNNKKKKYKTKEVTYKISKKFE